MDPLLRLFSIPSQARVYLIENASPTAFERAVHGEVSHYLNERMPAPVAARAVVGTYRLAELPVSAQREQNEEVIARAVWGAVIDIAQQVNVSDEKQGQLAALIWVLNRIDSDRLSPYGLERYPPSMKRMFATKQSEYQEPRDERSVCRICVFLAHLSLKNLLVEHTAALALPCMDLIRTPLEGNADAVLVQPPHLQAQLLRQMNAPDTARFGEWFARLHVAALWILARGRAWLDEARRSPDSRWDRRDVPAWLPEPLTFRHYESRGQLWAAWRGVFEEIAEDVRLPGIRDMARDMVRIMRPVVEVTGRPAEPVGGPPNAGSGASGSV